MTKSMQRNRIPLAGRNLMVGGAVGLAVVYFAVWTVFPFIYTFIYSFYDWQPLRPMKQ